MSVGKPIKEQVEELDRFVQQGYGKIDKLNKINKKIQKLHIKKLMILNEYKTLILSNEYKTPIQDNKKIIKAIKIDCKITKLEKKHKILFDIGKKQMEHGINGDINAILFRCGTCGISYISSTSNKERENKERLHNATHLI